ncbi:MAG: hypothetical protein IPM64_11600 [Phycisphaerales bacterium]|nr:hypothetical protein [Phycisphaerales bacterium]
MRPIPTRVCKPAPGYLIFIAWSLYYTASFAFFALFLDGLPERPDRPGESPPSLGRCCVVMLILTLAIAGLLAGRSITVDAHGIRRWWWVLPLDLWTWSDFASGRIAQIGGSQFQDPQRPAWRRRLGVGHLRQRDCDELLDLILERIPPQAPPSIPNVIEVRRFIRERARFDANGIRIGVPGRERVFRWGDVQALWVARKNPRQIDFQSAVLRLPSEDVEFRIQDVDGAKVPTWRNATGSELLRILMAHVPPERVCVGVVGRPLECRDWLIWLLRRSIRTRRTYMAFSGGSCFLLGVIASLGFGIEAATVLLAGTLLVFFPPILVQFWIHHGEERDVMRALASDTPRWVASRLILRPLF